MSMRKILIPVAAGLLFSPALMAADLKGQSTSRTFGDEFLGTFGASATVKGDILRVKLEAEYTLGDIVTLDYSGGALKGTSVPTTASAPVTTINGVTLGLLSADENQVVYRVTAVTPGTMTDTTNGSVVTFAAIDLIEFVALDARAADGVTVSYSAATDTGIALDTGGGDLRSIEYIDVDDQFKVTVTPDVFNAVIEVETERTTFTVGTADQAISTLANTPPAGGSATLVDQDLIWSGNFGWIIDDDPVAADVQPITGVVIIAGCTSVVVTATTISASCTSLANTLILDPSKNLDAAGELAILPGTSYEVEVSVNFTGTGASTGTRVFTVAGGSWKLNGFQALIPYMPYGSGIGQVIYLANRGSQSGDITVEWIDQNGNEGSLGVIASLGSTTTLSIGPIINAALPTLQRTTGRLALTVTANVPAADVQINSQYNVSGNRAFTLHEDNRPD